MPLKKITRTTSQQVPSGYVLGRASKGVGPTELLNLRDLQGLGIASKQDAAGGLVTIADGDLLANTSGGVSVPVATSLTALLDHVLGTAEGDIIYRGPSVWLVLAAGTPGQLLQTKGVAAPPQWSTIIGGVLPLVNGDTPGPVAIADSVGQFIGVPLS